jgi:uncharacterized membrane protein
MWWKLSIFLMLCGCAIGAPLRAFAQTQQPSAPPWDTWSGPWFMGGGGWFSFWWICPLMMVVMMLAVMFACRFMHSRQRD